MKILIIGGTALVGPHLIRELVSRSCTVATVTRTGKNYFGEQAFAADRLDQTKLAAVVREFRPDRIVDMIPFTQQQAIVLGAAVTEAKHRCPLVALSSIDIYAAYAKIQKTEPVEYQVCPIREDASLRTTLGIEGAAYDKLHVEKEYLDTFADITILRLPALYGWPDTTRVEGYLNSMLDGKDEIFIGEQRALWKFSRCLHKNAAYAISLCVLAGHGGSNIFNVAEEPVYSELGWCQRIGEICGWGGKIVQVSEPINGADFKQDLYVSTERIRSERGFFEKHSPDEGLADTISFHAYQRMGKPYRKYY